MRLRLGLLQDQAAIDRQIAREAAEAVAKKKKADIPTVKTEAETKADEAGELKEKEKGSSKSVPKSTPRIRPLSEAKAIDSGATFISETFLFGVGLSLIVFESWRQRRKETTRRGDVAEKLKELEEKDIEKWELLDELQREVQDLRAREREGAGAGKAGQSWFWNASKKDTDRNNAKHQDIPKKTPKFETPPAARSEPRILPGARTRSDIHSETDEPVSGDVSSTGFSESTMPSSSAPSLQPPMVSPRNVQHDSRSDGITTTTDNTRTT